MDGRLMRLNQSSDAAKFQTQLVSATTQAANGNPETSIVTRGQLMHIAYYFV